MSNKFQISLWMTLGLLLALPLAAHHSITAEFDTSKSFTVQGTLTKIEWVNPHAYVYLDSKDDKGRGDQLFVRNRPSRKSCGERACCGTMFVVGDTVTIDAYAAKDGSKHLGLVKAYSFCRRPHHSDGKRFEGIREPE